MGLIVADTPQLYDPADQPYAWFTMPMLLWWLGALTLLMLAAIGMAIAIGRRVNRLEDERPATPPGPRPTPHPRGQEPATTPIDDAIDRELARFTFDGGRRP